MAPVGLGFFLLGVVSVGVCMYTKKELKKKKKEKKIDTILSRRGFNMGGLRAVVIGVARPAKEGIQREL
jgi:hypothetical protein